MRKDAAIRRVVTPPIDIFEEPQGLVLVADLPGVSGETADVQMEESRLTLFGRLDVALPENAICLHEEFAVADYLRSFILSDDIDHDAIDAQLNAGVLTVRLPRAERRQARKIAIRTSSDEAAANTPAAEAD